MQEVGHMSWNYMCLLVGARWIEGLGVYCLYVILWL